MHAIFFARTRSACTSGSGGVRVADVMPRSPAQEAGLKAGDVLVSYNGKPLAVRFSSELPSARMQLATGPLGRPVELVLERGGRRLSLRVTPRSRKVSDDRIMYITGLGFYASEVNPELVRKQRLNCKSGIWVCGVEGGKLFARHGIRKGEVLVGLANHTALTMEIFWKEYRKMLMKKQTLLPFMVRQASGKTRLVKLRIVYPK